MNIEPPPNVIVMRPSRTASAPRSEFTTVLHVIAGDDRHADVAPVIRALERRQGFRQAVVRADAGPHRALVDVSVDRRVDLTRGTDAQRTADALVTFEQVLLEEQPQLVLLAGDEDVVLGAALAAAKLGIAVAHLGSGLRCWDWSLPDEVNRSVIDRLADTLFTCGEDASANLHAEGVPEGRIHTVGNTRIDTLRRCRSRALSRAVWRAAGVEERSYTLVTLQRLATIKPEGRLETLVAALEDAAAASPVLLHLHPRVAAGIPAAALDALDAAGAHRVEPPDYTDALSLLAGAGAVITDAGTVQEDASALGISCYTLLQTTPRTLTLTHGTNVLLGDDPETIATVRPSGAAPTPAAIPLWDGRAGERVADALAANYTLAVANAAGPLTGW